MQITRRRVWIVLALLSLAGCQKHGNLKGKVTFQGQPVLTGSVLAVGGDGVPKSAVIQEGAYIIESLPVGIAKLAVNSPDPSKSSVIARKPGTLLSGGSKKGWTAIPEKYAAFETSGLTFTIGGGQNTFDIKLE